MSTDATWSSGVWRFRPAPAFGERAGMTECRTVDPGRPREYVGINMNSKWLTRPNDTSLPSVRWGLAR